MSTIRSPEIATSIYAVDDSAIRDGGAGASHYLRVMAMQANRLVTHAEPFANLVWDSSTDGGAGDDVDSHDGVCTGFGYPQWVQILPPIVGTKRPGMRSMD